jgi:hypothetical protein
MKSFNVLLRRLHLYVALTCLPWFVMYSITAIAFNHGEWFNAPNDLYNLSGPTWTTEQSWPCSVDVPAEGDVPREVAAQILEVAGIQADAFHAFRLGGRQVYVNISDFWATRRLAYDPDKQELSLYSRQPVTATTMTLMHSRAGYRHDSLLNDLWAFMVDATVIGILVWIATGLYMWWQQRSLRKLGGMALAAGVLTFVAFLFGL